MTFLLGGLGWALLVAGALPPEVQRQIERSVPYWNARLVTLASALIEAGMGVALLRSLLVQAGLADALPSGGVLRSVVAAFLVLEGTIRAVAAGALRSSMASLPLLLAWRAVGALTSALTGAKRRAGST